MCVCVVPVLPLSPGSWSLAHQLAIISSTHSVSTLVFLPLITRSLSQLVLVTHLGLLGRWFPGVFPHPAANPFSLYSRITSPLPACLPEEPSATPACSHHPLLSVFHPLTSSPHPVINLISSYQLSVCVSRLGPQGALVGQQSQTFCKVMEVLQGLSAGSMQTGNQLDLVSAYLPLPGENPSLLLPPTLQPIQPHVPVPKHYTVYCILTQCSLVFEQQPSTYSTRKSKIVYLMGLPKENALFWAFMHLLLLG